jgi:membrane protein implicated in regulation of membrane protease activity
MLVFLSLAVVGILLTVLSAFFGHDFDVHPELEFGGLGFFSLRAMSIFLLTFGTVGALAHWLGRPTVTSSLWGLLAGVGTYALYVVAMQLVRSQQASSLIEDRELPGLTGMVTIAIPAGGIGEVTCRLKGQSTRRVARGAPGEAFSEGALVKVRDVQGDVLLVERMS